MSTPAGTLLLNWASNAWPTVKRILIAAVIVVAIFLLFNVARTIDWRDVLQAAQNIKNETLAMAIGLVLLGYTVYASFDLVARQYAHHAVPAAKVMSMAAISYGLNQSLGVLIGGVGARLRLYLKLGVDRSSAVRVVLFSTMTNWLGYCWLAGALLVTKTMPMPKDWGVSDGALIAAGAGMLFVAAGYLVFCALSKRRTWVVRSQRIELPSLTTALLQSVLAMLSWMTMGLIIYLLLDQDAPYLQVLAILLLSSIAAVIAHIPGGLGVTEAIFVAALAPSTPNSEVLAALLMYRVLYAIAPLCLALVAYMAIEVSVRRHSTV